MYQGYISLVAHTTKKSTYEGMLGREEGRPAYAIRAHSLPSIHGSVRERANTPHQPHKKVETESPHAPSSHPRKKPNVGVAATPYSRDHQTHRNAQIDRNKRDQLLALRPLELLEYRLDHPTRQACHGREHGEDCAMGAQQAAERRRVRRGVDRAVAKCCACDAR